MLPVSSRWKLFHVAVLATLLGTHSGFAGVSRAIQERYRRTYENKALFLKIPIFYEKLAVNIIGQSVQPERVLGAGSARFKVGDQVRVVGIDFGGDEIKLKLSAIVGTGLAEIIFKFDSPLQENFPNSATFDSALQATFTEGLKYTDLDDAKRGYVEQQFERAVQEISSTGGTNRDTVLKYVAPKLPGYQDALKDIENLKNRNQDLSAQIAQLQSENRKQESELRGQQAENARLRSTIAGLQEKIDNSTSQLARLSEDLRNARGTTQGYQKELVNLQRSLNIKVDTRRDLVSQITELGQAMRKIQKEKENLESQITGLQSNIESLQSANARLTAELEDSKAASQRLRDTINVLTSKEDSLARQYLQLKKVKEDLENIALSVNSLHTYTVKERAEGGIRSGKANVYLQNILLGTLDWSLPERLANNEEKRVEAHFSSESIDYVKVTPEERHILRSFGERLRLEVKLLSPSPALEMWPEKGQARQEVGERDHATWSWRIVNRGTEDSRLTLGAHLINRNGDDIPVLQRDQLVMSSSVVRQVKSYLQPIPMAVGGLIGFVLFAIVGIFRRTRGSTTITKRPPKGPAERPYIGPKQL